MTIRTDCDRSTWTELPPNLGSPKFREGGDALARAIPLQELAELPHFAEITASLAELEAGGVN